MVVEGWDTQQEVDFLLQPVLHHYDISFPSVTGRPSIKLRYMSLHGGKNPVGASSIGLFP